jgi:tetratricopeptide (TPR) repeat protein
MEPSTERGRALSAARAHLDRGFRFEQAGSLERALEAYRDALAARPTPVEEIEGRLRIARVYRGMASWEQSRTESTEAIRLANVIDAHDLAAEAMNVEVGSLQTQGFFAEADAIALVALERAQSSRVRGITLQNLGRSAAERREFAESDRYFSASIEAFRSTNYDVGLAVALSNAAKAALDRGDAERALEVGDEAISLSRRLNALDVLLVAVQNQAEAFVALGNLDSAESLLTEALGHFTSARNRMRQAECLEVMGRLSERRDDDSFTARRCYERARELALEVGDGPLAERLAQRLAALGVSRSAGDSTP